jgi:putative transposase
VLDVLVRSHRDSHAARRLMRKLLRNHGRAPRALITDKLRSYAPANWGLGLNMEPRQHKGLNNGAENSDQPT